jgi:dipeptide/tripeptide permease
MSGTATAQAERTGLSAIFYRFPRTFWLVNTFELFERGAFYTMMAILTYHFIYNVHISDSVVGIALGVLMFLLYFAPIVASALAEKVGYKNIFIFAFILIILGYLDFWKAHDAATLFVGVLAIGVGAGCFKPMVSATIAHVTPEKDRDVGYSIYYWMINLGAFIFPFIVGFYIERTLDDPGLYSLAFLISGFLVCINVAICLILFKDPVKADWSRTVMDSLKKLPVILKDKKFIILLVIYSGFWFVYSFNMTFLPVYIVDFGLRPMWFAIAWIGIVNPLTIIIAGPFLSRLVDKYSVRYSSIQLMIAGITLYVLGMSILAFWKTLYAWMFGIIVFSFGEFITHPSFISYVSKLAPKDKVAIYMGYAFIPIGIGNTIGSVASGFMYSEFSVGMHKPTIFWAIVSCIGLLTVAGLLMYNRHYTMKEAPAEEKAGPDGRRGVPFKGGLGRAWNMKATPVLVLIFIPLLLVSSVGVPADRFYRDEIVLIKVTDYLAVTENLGQIKGNSQAQSNTEIKVNISLQNVINTTFKLLWTDEAPPGQLWTNQPDQFSLKVVAPDGQKGEQGPVANAVGQEGRVTVTLQWDLMNLTGSVATGDYNVTIVMGNAGPNTLKRGPGVITRTDPGNDWTLDVSCRYFQEQKPEK